ncbi:MAG: hypothetical protein P9X24_13665 [Candidatus Hatepunaea meridiana]|nr:hypothetical protein [Candidatus Hatepunaea meridiana]
MTDTIHTLQEFMTHTKGILYIFAVCYLILFASFFKFINANERDEEVDSK